MGSTVPQRGVRIAVVVMVLAAAVTALLPGVILHGEVPAQGDLWRFHWPVKRMMVELWNASSAANPQWTPLLASGQPFAANPHFGGRHPSRELFRFLPFPLAFVLWTLLPLPIGAVGMGVLLTECGARRDTAWVLGPLWGLSGFALSMVTMPPIGWTALLAPGAAGLVVRAVR
jgi:hypothetical protein